jgi:ribosomal protein L22
MRQTAQAINGWKLTRAVKFLENVQEHKEAVAMRRYAGGTGRAAQGTRNTTTGMRIWLYRVMLMEFLQESNSVSPVLDGQSSLPSFSSVS